MKKIAFLLSIAIIIGWVSTAQATVDAGLQYLSSQQAADGTIGGLGVTGWAVMAYGANNQRNTKAVDALRTDQRNLANLSTTDIEKQILSLVAAGEDPRTFESADAIAALKARISDNQIGSVQYINDDIFGLIALKAAQEPVVSTVVQGVVANQNSDGGWSITKGGASSTDMTAVALIALKGTGVDQSVIGRGIDYIKPRQNDDGGVATASGASSLGSTTWVDWMIVSLGLPPTEWQKNGKSARDYIASLQQANGSWNSSVLLTSYSLIALSGRGFPVVNSRVIPTPSASPVSTSTPTLVPSSPPIPTPIATPLPTPIPTISATPSPSPSIAPTVPPTLSPTFSPLPTTTPLPSISPSPNLSPSPSSSPVSSPTTLLSPQPPPRISPSTPLPTPLITPTPTPSFLPSPLAVVTLNVTPTPTPMMTPSQSKSMISRFTQRIFSPLVSISPQATPSPSPSSSSSLEPSPWVPSQIHSVATPQPSLWSFAALPREVVINSGFSTLLLVLNTGVTGLEIFQARKKGTKH